MSWPRLLGRHLRLSGARWAVLALVVALTSALAMAWPRWLSATTTHELRGDLGAASKFLVDPSVALGPGHRFDLILGEDSPTTGGDEGPSAAPLAGALLYISQTKNVWTGGWALFSMAAGMSVPLLLTGVSAGSLLPRAGAWMNHVKRVFGLLLLAVAIWMVTPVFPVTVAMLLWGAFAVLCAVFLRVFEPIAAGAGLGRYAGKTLGLVLLTAGLFELVGAASAGQDVLQPLAHLRATNVAAAAQEGKTERFERIRTLAELDRVLASSPAPVMLDFYADWCVSCKEMERFTFSEPKVEAQMKQVRLLQVDVTANNDEDRALMKKFGLFGPPGIILFKQGKEVPESRVIGFMAPEQFAQHLSRHFAS